MKSHSKIPIVLALTFSLCLPARAATNYSMYAGSVCHPADGWIDTYTVLSSTNNGASYNRSTTATSYAVCPIIRDEYSSSSYAVSVYVYGYTTTNTVSCTPYSKSPSGTSGYTGSTVISPSALYNTLALSSTSASYYTEWISCALAPSYSTALPTSIKGYFVTEY